MKTDTITKFNHKRKLYLTPKHFLFFENLSVKTTYGAIILKQAALNKTVGALDNFELQRLLIKGFGMSAKELAGVIKKEKECSSIIDELLEILDSAKKRYMFLLDILNVSMQESGISEEEKQSVRIFSELLEVDEKKKNLIFDFIKFSYQLRNDKCIQIYEEMHLEKMDLSISELKYYIPEIEYVTTIHNNIINPGSFCRLVDHCNIVDVLNVPRGATLFISNAVIHMKGGQIVVDGGTLIIEDSNFLSEQQGYKELILVKSFSEIKLLNTNFECFYYGSVLRQENGNLEMKNCKIFHTVKQSAVWFWGSQAELQNNLFRDCKVAGNGAAIQIKNGSGLIKDCQFESCEAHNGGAVETIDSVMIQGCRFKYCKAIDFASAVYYIGELKSNLSNCEFYGCFPEKEEVIQYIGQRSAKTITKEYNISFSAIIDCPLEITGLGILNFTDVTVYLNYPIQCRGILKIKNARIQPYHMQEGDLIILEHAKGCLVEKSELNGRNKTGLIRAQGSKVILKKCLIRNTAGGRAIYNTFEPYIEECMFSNCLCGAVYSSSGSIINCRFINCREKSGAGILLYGSKGVIKDCRFIRCISDFSGGAIDRSIGNKVLHCTYEECRPLNIS